MSGWEITYRRRWRFYPTWMPWGRRRLSRYVSGGGFTYAEVERKIREAKREAKP